MQSDLYSIIYYINGASDSNSRHTAPPINVFDIDIVLHDLCFGFCLTQFRPGNQIISWINLRLQSIVEALWDIIPILLETP